MLAGSVIGVPGPVATTRPPCTCRLSTAVGGRYRPTLVRSSPSSGAMSTRSPTTIRRLGDSSGMGSIIHPRAPAGLAHGGNGDVDHVHRLTGLGAALLMRPCRRGSRGPAHVLVGRSAHGVVLLVRPGTFPIGVRRFDLGSAPAWRRAILAHGEEPGYVALRDARFELAPAGSAVDRVRTALVLVRHRGHDLHLHAASDDERAALGLDGLPDRKSVV